MAEAGGMRLSGYGHGNTLPQRQHLFRGLQQSLLLLFSYVRYSLKKIGII
jgi:hypothetical protein